MHLLIGAEPRVVGTAAKAVFINNIRRAVPETNLDAAGTVYSQAAQNDRRSDAFARRSEVCRTDLAINSLANVFLLHSRASLGSVISTARVSVTIN